MSTRLESEIGDSARSAMLARLSIYVVNISTCSYGENCIVSTVCLNSDRSMDISISE